MNSAYKVCFVLFGASLVLPTSLPADGNFSKPAVLQYLSILASALLLLFGAYDTVVLCYSTQIPMLQIPYVLLCLMALANRYRLGKKFQTLKLIAKIMSNFEVQEGRGFKLFIYPYMAVTSVQFIAAFAISLYTRRHQTHAVYLFGYSGLLWEVLYSLHRWIIMRIPMNTFVLFYVTVCHHTRMVLKGFSRRLYGECIVNYQELTRSYASIKATIDFLDNELSFFAFCQLMYTSMVIFFIISSILRGNLRDMEVLELFILFSTLVQNCVSFIVMTTFASLVSEASSELYSRAKTLTVNLDTTFTPVQQKFLLCFEREINFTVWKMFPMKRSIVMATFGSILTYVMLLDSLMGSGAKSEQPNIRQAIIPTSHYLESDEIPTKPQSRKGQNTY